MPTRTGIKPATGSWPGSPTGIWADVIGAWYAPSGSSVPDETSAGHDLTLQSGADILSVGGLRGDCLRTNSSGGAEDTTISTDFDSLTALTMVTHFQLGTDNTASNSGLFGIENTGSGNDATFVFWISNETFSARCESSGGSGSVNASSRTVNLSGSWVTIAHVVDIANDTLYIYQCVDGNASSMDSTTITGLSTLYASNILTWMASHQYGAFDAGVGEFCYLFESVLTQSQLDDIHTDPYSWYASGVTLTVADATHGHAADNVALVQANTLSVAETSHAQAADNVSLTQQSTLSVAESTHAHTVDNIDLLQSAVLSVVDALHAQTADNLDLVQQASLTVAESTHAHTADNLDLTQANQLTVAEAAHSQTADNVTLATGGSLLVDDSTHAHTADTPDLVQANLLAIDDALHTHTADTPGLIQANVLTAQSATHGHTADNVSLEFGVILSVSDAAHAQLADSPGLVQANILSVLDAVHAHTADSPSLSAAYTLIVSDALHAHLADNVTLTEGVEYVTPDGRTFTISSQDRVLAIHGADRTFVIAAQDRVFSIQ